MIPPPNKRSIVRHLTQKEMRRVFDALLTRQIAPSVGGRYLHWEDVMHRTPPAGLSPEGWWFGIKMARGAVRRELPLRDRDGRTVHYVLADPLLELLHEVDVRAGAGPTKPGPDEARELSRSFLEKSLRDEGVDSSLLEGAATTRREALRMLDEGRQPRTPGERMVFNNYWALERVKSWRHETLTSDHLLELHALITRGTLDDPEEEGRFRRPVKDDDIVVEQASGRVLYHPPPAAELPERMERLLAFANRRPEEFTPYLPPLIHAIALHLQLAMDHPFTDGNGRVARALFYWAMARHGYTTCEYVSISSYVRRRKSDYLRAFLHVETDDADATYFLLHQLRILKRALDDLKRYVAERSRGIARLGDELLEKGLNQRQVEVIAAVLRNPATRFTYAGHQRWHRVSYGTAHHDLQGLVRMGLLIPARVGHKMVFRGADRLEERLRRL